MSHVQVVVEVRVVALKGDGCNYGGVEPMPTSSSDDGGSGGGGSRRVANRFRGRIYALPVSVEESILEIYVSSLNRASFLRVRDFSWPQ